MKITPKTAETQNAAAQPAIKAEDAETLRRRRAQVAAYI
ncbi:hypothetical protein H261_06379 [Paramagnetospirillum caucaseum]|uniref:Uncharacterized protein n=1 Tax=Paramagnetospirillum caucaseum TaxID=1244869 RepID=M2YCW5_9PROT|nr:hypothetical protein H261_06379 [Paramagnetospirillum caucaseum]